MDRTWFVTGTSSGLGREIARAALAAGDRVVATARRTDGLADLVEQAPDHVRAVALDVTDPAAVRAAVDVAVAEFGRIDVVVNNAGYGSRGALEELSDEQVRAQFDVNVFGVLEVVIVSRTGKRVLATVLVVAAIVWLPLNKVVEGPKLLVLSRSHAITTADLLSVLLVLVALGLLWSTRRR
jgi:NAD(P)-dependent dehydrogenase (short-subunit alcohol dehydrogenase family)